MDRQRFSVTTPIYYINDRPHVGTAYTTIAADVLARYWRQRLGKGKVFFLTGTDEHGAKIERRAKSEGKAPKDFADEVAAVYEQTWTIMNISFDDFIRTTEPRHKKVVVKLVTELQSATTPKGNLAIYEGHYTGLYCVGHEAFMKDSDLADGLCPDHKTKPETVTEKNWFFRLSDYNETLQALIEAGEFTVAPETRKNEILGYIAQGLEDVAITRPNVAWGIPVPFDKKQTIYVWVDALMNYVSALGGPGGAKYKKFWPADVHLIGKDITKFHCLIWPALLLALKLPLPKMVFAHGFFTVNGQKMSKSLGNAVDPLTLVETYGNDALRYSLLRDIAFGTDGDFSEDRLKERYSSDLANGLGNLVSRVTNMVEKYADGKFTRRAKETPAEFTKAMDILRFDEALRVIWNHVDAANKTIDDRAPWTMAKEGKIKESKNEELKNLLNELANTVLDVNDLLAPFLPESSAKISAAFKKPVKKAEPLFPRLT